MVALHKSNVDFTGRVPFTFEAEIKLSQSCIKRVDSPPLLTTRGKKKPKAEVTQKNINKRCVISVVLNEHKMSFFGAKRTYSMHYGILPVYRNIYHV